MAEYHGDTFHCVTLHVRTIVQRSAVYRISSATSFLISCANCLWDAVGYFLGRSLPGLSPREMGLPGNSWVGEPWATFSRPE